MISDSLYVPITNCFVPNLKGLTPKGRLERQ
jgi:hypothetical protein